MDKSLVTLNQTVGDRYRLQSVLGRGGFGTVFCALQAPLDRPVALKVCHATTDDRRALARFEREARIIAKLRSPHTVRLYDFGLTEDNHPYFAMEMINGRSLAEELTLGALTPIRIAQVLSEVCESLAEAHAHNVLHLDLKPANIMVESISGRGEMTRVLDFGIARIRDSERVVESDHNHSFVGTPMYMAPELLLGNPITTKTDLYALGLLMDECLRGTPTFRSAKSPLYLAQHFDNLPPLPFDTPPGLASLRNALLSADPDTRPESASAVRQAMVHWLAENEGFHAKDTRPSPIFSPNPTAPTIDLDWSMGSNDDSLVTQLELQVPVCLPFHASRFVGRRNELSQLTTTLADRGQRVVTLAGTGGSGKTRLGIQFGQERQLDYPGGVWFCDLAEARSLEGIARAVAQTMGLPLAAGDPIVRLGNALAVRGRTLLILDNFEQVVEHAEASVGVWLTRAQQTDFLVTSREALRLPGERVLEVPPFSEDDAIALFLEHAEQARPNFHCTAEDRVTIQDITQRLDGLPLAIELAANRLRTLTLDQLHIRLAERFRVLSTRDHGQGSRRATMRAAIDWSWDLLTPVERLAFAQCSIFRGGFTLEAAEDVLDFSGFKSSLQPDEVIGALVDKHLLHRSTPASGMLRFGLYESLREYGTEKMAITDAVRTPDGWSLTGPDARDAIARRHMTFYSDYGRQEHLELLKQREAALYMARQAAELENLLVATENALNMDAGESAALCITGAEAVFNFKGPTVFGLNLINRVLALDLPDDFRGPLIYRASRLQYTMGQIDTALASLREAAAIGEGTNDLRLVVRCLGWQFWIGSRRGEEELDPDVDRVLALSREVGDTEAELMILGFKARTAHNRGEIKVARSLYQKRLELAQHVGNRRIEANAFGHYGNLLDDLGDVDGAREAYLSALAISRELKDLKNEADVLGNLAFFFKGQGFYEEALDYFHRARDLFRSFGSRLYEGYTWGNLGELYLKMGQMDTAFEHFETGLAMCEEAKDAVGSGAFSAGLGVIYAHRGQFDRAWSFTERALELLREKDAIEYGKAVCIKGEVARLAHLPEVMNAALREAQEVAASAGAQPDSELGQAIERLISFAHGTDDSETETALDDPP